jgi:hypothetical protein
MIRYTKAILLSSLLAGLMFMVPAASAQRGGFRGGFHGGFYGPVYGPGWGWGLGWGPGFYNPAWYGPYGAYYVPGSSNPTGEVKIDTKAKDAMVYVDGGYAGTVGSLKTFHLKAGEHDVELRDPSGHSYFQEHVNVLAGRTLKLNPETK